MTRLADSAAVRIAESKLTHKQLQITVLSGGPSAEREVSLKSGRAVAAALESLGHKVRIADIAPDSLEALAIPADLVFIALHGSFGEDGQLQQILERHGIRYTGSGPEASALAMDKVAAKYRFIEAEVPTPRFDVVEAGKIDEAMRNWSLPVVVKPIADGSSVDTTIVRDPAGLRDVLSRMTAKYGRCLVEQYIAGPELTVGVLRDEPLPPIQIRTRREFYNYEAKYLDEDTEYLFDIDLPAPTLRLVQDLSVKAGQALGCRDFCRVDWMVDAVTLQPYCLEINTIPGFTDHSLLPKAAAKAGIGFAMLCQRIVESALAR
ncbi:MAG TPA: D-alanine--D-alanine ligase [Phycisphaerae bacterium]|nr:D-alanine--D-alanine ligase [Phycisphaerae bacterium]HOJ55642.1 D-alanine--D-alanine ligase [Phycisphaerae bacterium]HOL27653.1 D-alanine--D-alanine ligase [Phycisphaerae bacterium]HPP21955.1 D-alanine--D-alanine ligase [Phycisphaerae bacterium]HPU33572.1 D-alanine--D-alanine ligase [Phycisphaerae bacterium]